MQTRPLLVAVLVTALLASALAIPAARHAVGDAWSAVGPVRSADTSSGTSRPEAAEVRGTDVEAGARGFTLAAKPVTIDGETEFAAWALLNRTTGVVQGSSNLSDTNSTESMIKVWVVADYLRRLGDADPTPELLGQASAAIRDSDNAATEALFRLGGGAAVIDRLITMCRLADTHAVIPSGKTTVWWSYTQMSARDAVQMAECVANGTAAGPRWTEWVLDEMSAVRGTTAAADQHDGYGGGRWGIIDGLPAELVTQQRISIKNGWTMLYADGLWHVNCLAVTTDWALAVLLRYPGTAGLEHGARLCASVAEQLVTPRDGQTGGPHGSTVH
jgi:hypothetical protein